MDLLQQEGHIGRQCAHGLHALGIEFHLSLASTVGDVPVLTLAAGLMTTTTVDAHTYRLPANLNDFCFDTVFLQGRLYLLQSAERVTVGSWAAVD